MAGYLQCFNCLADGSIATVRWRGVGIADQELAFKGEGNEGEEGSCARRVSCTPSHPTGA